MKIRPRDALPKSKKLRGRFIKGVKMKLSGLKKHLTIGAAGLLLTVSGATMANAQSRDYYRAQREVQRQCSDYQRNPTRENYRDCAEAQRRLQAYSNGYYNNGYSNNGYYPSTQVYNSIGQPMGRSYGTTYRVYRNGSYYSTDYRGAELLRQAVNNGYRQGYAQGQRDRRYGRGMNYYGNSIYSSGTYGYQSYVARDQYQYYFQQGFQRGYEDGFNSSYRYGYRSGNSLNILGTVLGTILNFAQD